MNEIFSPNAVRALLLWYQQNKRDLPWRHTSDHGGISREGDELLLPIREFVYANDYNKHMPKTEIRIARLFNDAGIVGAALAAKNME